MNNILLSLVYLIMPLLILFTSAGCGNENQGEGEDVPTRGKINISVDETVRPLMEAEIAAFEGIYKYAHITASYLPENLAMEKFINDSARIVVVSRELTDMEKKYFEALKIIPKTLKVAYDGVSLIINNQNNDSLITSDQLKKIISGEFSNWKQLGGKASNNPIQLVFDNSNSSTVRFIKEYTGNAGLPANSFAVNNNESVINYITGNRNAIGIIGVSWISDKDDSASNSFLDMVRVMEIAPYDTGKGAGDYYKPYQAYIAQKYYPLWRNVYIISREARAGLGTGLTGFIAGDRGQRIVLKSGLVPATMPVRLVEVYNQPLNITK